MARKVLNAEHVTVKVTYDPLDIKKSSHHCILDICDSVTQKHGKNMFWKVTVTLTFNHQIVLRSFLSQSGHLCQI